MPRLQISGLRWARAGQGEAPIPCGSKARAFAAARWYEDRRVGLGDELLDEVTLALKRLERFPGLGSESLPGYRRCFVQRFPYTLIYRASAETIVVIAVSHHKRRPGYWRRRATR